MTELTIGLVLIAGLFVLFLVAAYIGRNQGQREERNRVLHIMSAAHFINDSRKVSLARDLERLISTGVDLNDADVAALTKRHSVVKSERTLGPSVPIPQGPISIGNCIVCGKQHGQGMPCPTMLTMSGDGG
jgi:hypothetical protein